jgi:hypothetical protein
MPNTVRLHRVLAMASPDRMTAIGDWLSGRCWLRAQPVDATPSILIDKGLKPMAFLRRGLATIRGCTSTSERDQEPELLAIGTDLTRTCCCVS